MPNERTPLGVAREIKAGAYINPSTVRAYAHLENLAHVVAAALIEKCAPVEATRRQVTVLLCCDSTVSGYPEDHFSRLLPKFCPGCGRPITWK